MVSPETGIGGGCILRIEQMMKNNVPIPIAEMNSDSFRPRVSTKKEDEDGSGGNLVLSVEIIHSTAIVTQTP